MRSFNKLIHILCCSLHKVHRKPR